MLHRREGRQKIVNNSRRRLLMSVIAVFTTTAFLLASWKESSENGVLIVWPPPPSGVSVVFYATSAIRSANIAYLTQFMQDLADENVQLIISLPDNRTLESSFSASIFGLGARVISCAAFPLHMCISEAKAVCSHGHHTFLHLSDEVPAWAVRMMLNVFRKDSSYSLACLMIGRDGTVRGGQSLCPLLMLSSGLPHTVLQAKYPEQLYRLEIAREKVVAYLQSDQLLPSHTKSGDRTEVWFVDHIPQQDFCVYADSKLAKVSTQADIWIPSSAMACEKPVTLLLISESSLQVLSETGIRANNDNSRVFVALVMQKGSMVPFRHSIQLEQSVDVIVTMNAEDARTVHYLHNSVAVYYGSWYGLVSATMRWAAARIPLANAHVQLPGAPGLLQTPQRVVLQVSGLTIFGGLEQFVFSQAMYLQQAGWNVSVLNLGDSGDAQREMQNYGVYVVNLPITGMTPEQAEQTYANTIRAAAIVVAHHSPYGADVCAAAGVPFIHTIHGTYVLSPRNIQLAYKQQDEFVTAYVGISALSTGYLTAALELDVDKFVQLSIGANGSRIIPVEHCAGARRELRKKLGYDEEHFVFVILASMYAVKGQLHAVHAMQLIRERCPQARLLLVGAADDQQYVQQLRLAITSLGLENIVTLVPYSVDIGEILCAADVFMAPSLTEGWSTSIGEAVMAGLPVIASRVGAAAEQLYWTKHSWLVDVLQGRMPWEHSSSSYYALLSHELPYFRLDLATAMHEAYSQKPAHTTPLQGYEEVLERRNVLKRHEQLLYAVLQGIAPGTARALFR